MILTKKLIKRIHSFFSIFAFYKLVLLIFYGIGSFQNFTSETTRIILRTIITTDTILLFLAPINILVEFKIEESKLKKIRTTLISLLLFLSTFITTPMAFFLIVFTG